VASGTYREAIQVVTGVNLFGGFSGSEGLDQFQLRNWELNETIIDGGARIVPIVTCGNLSILDGFHIRNSGTTSRFHPIGAIHLDSVDSSVSNCTVVGNLAPGLTVAYSEFEIDNCLFKKNEEGMRVSHSTGTISNCRISENIIHEDCNSGRWRGAGLFVESSTLSISSCCFDGNTAEECNTMSPLGTPRFLPSWGGGCLFKRSSVLMNNCLVTENFASIGSGIKVEDDSNLELVSCSVVANKTGRYATGVLWDGSLLIRNSILWEKDFRETLTPERASSSFSLIRHAALGPGDIDADPLFVDPEHGDFRLQYDSPCIDSGTIAEVLTDLDGNARPVDIPGLGTDGPGAFDMGAYEYQFPKGDLSRNGYMDPMDLFILGGDWMKVSGAR